MSTAEDIDQALDRAVRAARQLGKGAPASYIPELANADLETTGAAVVRCDGSTHRAGDADRPPFTIQSTGKLVLLAGLLEERGEDDVFSRVGKEPSGSGFRSIEELETQGPLPSNPLINPGAILLCGQLRGAADDRRRWLADWVERLYGRRLPINERVMASETRTGDRNRAIAYLLSDSGVLDSSVDETLAAYFALCSFEASIATCAHLPAVLANGGVTPGGERVLSQRTASVLVSLMATCGMYDESGTYLTATGLPAKSGVSGIILAVSVGCAGIAVGSPRINHKGGSVRGHAILEHLSKELRWHFALSPARSE
ncbi:MAG: glutaminase A [Myxococcota bacterium]